MEQLYNHLLALVGPARVRKNEPMRDHTTFRLGGCADLCLFPESEEEIRTAMELADKRSVPCLVVGNGSNLIVKDGGIRGLVILLGERFSKIEVAGCRITAQAGAKLSQIANVALEHSLTGLEFASGIPGSVGGGTAMNAGAYGGQLSDVLTQARVLREGEIVAYALPEMEMGYRSTRPLREGSVVLSSTFCLKEGDREEIAATMRDLNARRREKQPLNYPSAGSVFKRPTGYFAGALIEQANLKGERVGDACVSEKHAGFIVNLGSATASDVLGLIARVQQKVLEQSGVHLECEVRIVGEDPA